MSTSSVGIWAAKCQPTTRRGQASRQVARQHQRVYLCGFQNIYPCQVVYWQMRGTMPERLIASAIRWALLAR